MTAGSISYSGDFGPAFLEKSIHEAMFGPGVAGGTGAHVSVVARRLQSRSLRPKEIYEAVVTYNRGVSLIAGQLASARIRFFTRDGREVTGGKIVSDFRAPAPRLSQSQWVQELFSWLLIVGEMAIDLREGATSPLAAMLPLDPTALKVAAPERPRSLAEVQWWEYRWNAEVVEKIPGRRLAFMRMFNPSDPIRGLSPAVTGATEASTLHYAGGYNQAYFEHGGIPSHLIVLPQHVSKQAAEDFEERWEESFGRSCGAAHKYLVVRGTEAKVETLEDSFQDGAFMALMERDDKAIARLLGVPGLMLGLGEAVAGDPDKDLEMFADQTLLPLARTFSDMLQVQIVDVFYTRAATSNVQTAKATMTKGLSAAFEKARDDRPASNVIVLLDPDTLPIMAKIQLSRTQFVKALREDLMFSPKEAADFAGVDSPEPTDPKNEEVRNHVWIPAKVINVTRPEVNPQWGQDPKGGEPREEGQEVSPARATGQRPDRSAPSSAAGERRPKGKPADGKAVAAVKGFFRRLRAESIRRVESGEPCWTLAEAKAMADEAGVNAPAVRNEIRALYLNLRGVFRSTGGPKSADDRKPLLKAAFNAITSRSHLRSLAAAVSR